MKFLNPPASSCVTLHSAVAALKYRNLSIVVGVTGLRLPDYSTYIN